MSGQSSHCRRFVIRGRVQGVCYRASAQRAARDLALAGWVRNLADGSVEALAVGSDAALAAFERWLWQGPPRARVSAVEACTAPLEHHRGFVVREDVG